MKELITLDRRHPDFMKYLLGTFARDKRALPVKSLNLRTDRESVTFEVVPVAQVSRPPWLVVWLKALRPRAFLPVLVPIILILLLTPPEFLDPDMPWLATAGVLFLLASVLLRNDVEDHLSGLDRVRSDRGSRAIQNGWLTAQSLRDLSIVFLVLSILCALPVLFAHPSVVLIFLVTVPLGGLAFFRTGRSYKELLGGEFLLFLLGGPLLAVGYQVAVSGGVSLQTLLLGLLWGWLLLFPIFLRDLEHLIADGQSGRGSLIGRLGFDRGVKLISIWWFLGLAAFVAYHAYFMAPMLFWVLVFLFVLSSARFSLLLKSLKSPAGSQVSLLRRRGEFYFYGLILLWVLEELWRHPL